MTAQYNTASQQVAFTGKNAGGSYLINPDTGQPYNASTPLPTSATLSAAANQRVNALAGDFVAGAIVDLATLLTLAGAPTDANTVNSLMGRLTKIRDLLNTTLTISGNVTEANSASILADLATLAGAVSSSKMATKASSGDFADGAITTLGTEADTAWSGSGSGTVVAILKKVEALLAATLAISGTITANAGTNLNTSALALESGGNLAAAKSDLDTVAGAITGNRMQSNVAQIAGTTASVNAGTIDNGTQRVVQGGAATGTKSNVSSSASSVTILAANTARKGAMIYNDSTQVLYLDLSGGTAASSSYSLQVPSNGLFELPGPTIYNGAITGIWAAANGNARVTEFS